MNTENKEPEPATPEPSQTPRSLGSPPVDYPRDGTETLLAVRYGKMQHRGRFRSRTPGLIYNEKVVVQSERGVEIGEVAFTFQRDGELDEEPQGWVLGRATLEEIEKHQRLNEPLEPGPEFEFCQERIAALDLPMQLVDVERPFGGGKIIFFFTADGRVDFRALVRDLAKRYRTRIEMKQIGVRDEAKVLGDIADCGRELCCRAFLTRLQPISMRMAKVQKTTLDPAKISGRCGRLKCCLRYEYDAYLALRTKLPRAGARVRAEGRPAVVVGMDVLSQQVIVLLDRGERLTVHVDQLDLAPAGPAGPETDRERGAESAPAAESTAPAGDTPAVAGPAGPEPADEVRPAPPSDGTDGGSRGPARRRSGGRGRGPGRAASGRARGGERRPPGSGGESKPVSDAPAPEKGAKKKEDRGKRGRRRRGRSRRSPGNRSNGGRRGADHDGGDRKKT